MNIHYKVNQFGHHRGKITYIMTCFMLAIQPCFGIAASSKSALIDSSSRSTWIDEKWTGNNAAYDKARTELSAFIPNTSQFQAALEKYHELAQKNPSYPMAQFRWGYLALRFVSRLDDYTTGVKTMYDVNQALALAPSPHTYQYTRLRLLVGNWSVSYYSTARLLHVNSLGKRLLVYNPNDSDVKYVMADILDVGDKYDRQQALQYAQELVQAQPSIPANYALLGSIYDISIARDKSPENAQKAIAAYQQFLNLAPANDKFRVTAQAMIDKLKQRARK